MWLNPNGLYRHVAYRILHPSDLIGLVVTHEESWPATKAGPLAASVLDGSLGLDGILWSASARLVVDIFSQDGSQRTLDISKNWIQTNPEQTQWLASAYG